MDITNAEFVRVLTTTKDGKTPGPDNLYKKVLKTLKKMDPSCSYQAQLYI